MELSEIVMENNTVREVARYRIQPPNGINSYCEKNWMPVISMPYHFVKWTNPTELVKVNIETLQSETVYLGIKSTFADDLRGGSQVIEYGGCYFAVTHEVNLFKSETGWKDCFYYHRFVRWNKDWTLKSVTDRFNFMGARVEFCCGAAINPHKPNEMIISFGYQDNTAFVASVPFNLINELIYD
jgi:hypothetical protein